MGRSKVHVSVRARPTGNFASDIMTFNESANYIKLALPKEDIGHVNGPQSEDDKFNKMEFKVNKVLQSASQEQVFECCAREVVQSVMKGYNGTILAYGQTGAGKTHTMTGGHVGFEDRGVVPRAISHIYQEAENMEGRNITIRLSYVEIYNELMFDLLAGTGVAEQTGDLIIAEEKKNGRDEIRVKGLSLPVAGTKEEALHIFFQGDTNRHVAEHALNKGSTRSHCVFTIHVESRARHDCNDKGFNAKCHLVDLAGSERVKKTGTDGVTLKEASYINKSLSFLEQVVKALGEPGRDHIPYRQSKLTHLLKDSLGGNCKTAMIANIWPEKKMLEETISTLRFAQRMQKVYNDAVMNEHTDPSTLLRKYERQIKELKQELAMHNTLANRGHVQYDTYSPEEERDLDDKVQKYLDGELFELEVESVRMSLEAFKCFRKKHQEMQRELNRSQEQLQRGGFTSASPPGASPDEGGEHAGEGEQATGAEGFVGESEERGISVGIAPSGSRPNQETHASEGEAGDSGFGNDQTRVAGMHGRGGGGGGGEGERPPDKQSAFAEWKAREGEKFEADFEKNRQELKDKKEVMRLALNAANVAKREIDEAKDALGRKQADAPPDSEVIDSEEYALLKTVRDKKQLYRDQFEKHRSCKGEVDQLNQLMRMCKQKLIQAFDEWYEQRWGGYGNEMAGADTGKGERYDPQEMFDLMEQDRLESHDPDKLAYTKARKYADRAVRQKKSTSVGAQARRR